MGHKPSNCLWGERAGVHVCVCEKGKQSNTNREGEEKKGEN